MTWLAIRTFMKSPLGKLLGGVLLAAALVWGFTHWLSGREKAAYQRGAAAVTQELKDAQAAANIAARQLETSMQLNSNLVAARNDTQTAALTVKLEPLQKELTREVQADPHGACTVSDGVRRTLDAQRAAVNSSIVASDPSQP